MECNCKVCRGVGVSIEEERGDDIEEKPCENYTDGDWVGAAGFED